MVSSPSKDFPFSRSGGDEYRSLLFLKDKRKKEISVSLLNREGNTVSLHFGKQARHSIPSNKWYNGSNGAHSVISIAEFPSLYAYACVRHNMVEYRRKPMKVSMTNFMLRRLPVLANFTVHRNCRSHRKVRFLYLIEN